MTKHVSDATTCNAACVGPPGTGKTVTSATIVYQLAKLGQGQVRLINRQQPRADQALVLPLAPTPAEYDCPWPCTSSQRQS